jgi:translocation and assembly module TamB
VRAADRVFAFDLVPAPDGAIVLTAHTPDNEARLRLVWSGAEIKGDATLWNQPVQLAARFPAQGWLPAEASAVAANWRLPAARARLGAPYAQVLGDGRLLWRDGTFELSFNARAEPAAGDRTKAPPFAASAAAHGSLRELILTDLHVDAPFATASLTAPVTFSLDHPLSAEAARLTVQADLAKLPWLEARGHAQGTVTVAASDAIARQDFELELTDVTASDFTLKKARARGLLQWPRLELTELKVQLDEASSIEGHGAANWQTRELTGVALNAKLESTRFARWLPTGTKWAAAEVTATAEGPLDAPRHQGSIKLTQMQWKPLQPLAIAASWQGEGTKLEISATATANNSTLELAGSLDPHGLLLGKLQFAPAGQVVWQLAAPARLTWAPAWQIDNLQLSGRASALTLKGKGEPEGSFDLTASEFDSAWLRDWVTVTGPGWQMRTLHSAGHVDGGALVFESELTAQIEMSSLPARVKLVASGDAHGVQLKELKVVDGERVLTQATGRLPLAWMMQPEPHLSPDETAPLELIASTEPDSPLWATLAAYTGLELVKPEAKINLKGTLRQPAGELQLKFAQMRATAGRFKFPLPEFDDVALKVNFAREAVTLTSFTGKVEGQAMQGSGHVPMDDGQWQRLWRQPAAFDWSKIEARLEIPDADLAPIARRFPTFAAALGRLHAQLELKPGGKFSGELQLTDAASRPLPPFGTLQEIKADLALNDRTLTVRTLTAKLGGEPVVLDGSATFGPGGGAPKLALGLKGKNLPLVRNTGLLLRVDLDLHADTDAAGLTRLGGTVEVRDCLMLASLSLRALLPTGVHGVTRQPPYFAVETEPFNHWPLDVAVRAARSVRLRTTVFNGTASARFKLGGTLGEPRAVGDLTMDQGQVLFPFATFKVDSGTVRLRESDPFRAVVNLTANSQRRDYQLRLEATGELPTPNILLSSTPSLEAGEVLLMVMTGQPPTGGSGIGGASGTQRLAVLGAYLSRGLFQDLGFGGEERLEVSAGEQVSLEGRDTYEFEYKLGERWSALGEYDRFDAYNAGLKWRLYTQESVPGEKK